MFGLKGVHPLPDSHKRIAVLVCILFIRGLQNASSLNVLTLNPGSTCIYSISPAALVPISHTAVPLEPHREALLYLGVKAASYVSIHISA